MFNVGGVRLESSRATLTRVPDSMLGLMFERCGQMLQVDPVDGSIFINRNGDRFGFTLDFLTGGEISNNVARTIRALPENELELMMQELDYCGLEAAVFPPSWFESAVFSAGSELNEGRSYFAAAQCGRRVFVFGGYGTTRYDEGGDALNSDDAALDSPEVARPGHVPGGSRVIPEGPVGSCWVLLGPIGSYWVLLGPVGSCFGPGN